MRRAGHLRGGNRIVEASGAGRPHIGQDARADWPPPALGLALLRASCFPSENFPWEKPRASCEAMRQGLPSRPANNADSRFHRKILRACIHKDKLIACVHLPSGYFSVKCQKRGLKAIRQGFFEGGNWYNSFLILHVRLI